MRLIKNIIQMRKSGQMLLITILVLTIVITISLALVTRTTGDIGISGRLEESARAFSAAEAGIEDALQNRVQRSDVVMSKDTSYTTKIDTIDGVGGVYRFTSVTPKGDAATMWLVSHNADGTLNDVNPAVSYCTVGAACTIDVCWDESDPMAATEVIVYYKVVPTGLYDLQRFAYDPKSTRTANNFDRITETSGCGKASGVHKVTVTLPTTDSLPLFLRLRPYYQDALYSVSAETGRTLPDQYTEVSSVGKTGSGVTRKIVVKKEFETIPWIFDYVLYSSGDIKYSPD